MAFVWKLPYQGTSHPATSRSNVTGVILGLIPWWLPEISLRLSEPLNFSDRGINWHNIVNGSWHVYLTTVISDREPTTPAEYRLSFIT